MQTPEGFWRRALQHTGSHWVLTDPLLEANLPPCIPTVGALQFPANRALSLYHWTPDAKIFFILILQSPCFQTQEFDHFVSNIYVEKSAVSWTKGEQIQIFFLV